MANESDEYDVGRGKPPKWSQYRKGQSGNPNGRPRKKVAPEVSSESELDDILRSALDRKVQVTQGGESRTITTKELLVNAQIKTAVAGNANAQREVMLAMRALEERDAEEKQNAKEWDREIFLKVVNLKKLQTQFWDDAAKNDCEPDDPWPHPDDIRIDHERRTYRVRGPLDATDVPFFEYFRAERDALFARAAVADLARGRSNRAVGRFFQVLWLTFDLQLPQRWQAATNPDHSLWSLYMLPLRRLEALADNYRAEANKLRTSVLPDGDPKEAYRFANSIMKPLFKQYGYRSLAEFERAYANTAGNPPWPKEA